MVRVSYKPEGKNPLRQVLMHRPELESAWDYVSRTMRENTILPEEMREQVRATLAALRGCKH